MAAGDGGRQRNLNFRREENNVCVCVGGLYNKGVCLRLIISSCKNTKGEARLARDVISRQLLTGLLNGTLLGLWGGEGNPAKDK